MSKLARLHHHLRGVHPVSGRHLAGNLGGGCAPDFLLIPVMLVAMRSAGGIAGFFCGCSTTSWARTSSAAWRFP